MYLRYCRNVLIGAKVAPADAGGSGGRKADLPQLLFELSRWHECTGQKYTTK